MNARYLKSLQLSCYSTRTENCFKEKQKVVRRVFVTVLSDNRFLTSIYLLPCQLQLMIILIRALRNLLGVARQNQLLLDCNNLLVSYPLHQPYQRVATYYFPERSDVKIVPQ